MTVRFSGLPLHDSEVGIKLTFVDSLGLGLDGWTWEGFRTSRPIILPTVQDSEFQNPTKKCFVITKPCTLIQSGLN